MDIDSEPHVDFFYLVHEAMMEGDIPMLERIAAENPPFPLGQDEWLTRHWLTNAIHTGNLEAMAWVLSKGPDVHYVDDEGYTALKSVLEMETETTPVKIDKTARTIEMIDMLLEAGAHINQRMTLDETALHAAVYRSSPRVVAHLLAKGADPHAYDAEYQPQQPIHYVQYFKYRAEVEALLREAMGR